MLGQYALTRQWKTVIAIGLIYLAVVNQWFWVWGILFIMWAIPALFSERVNLSEELTRRNNPYLYWLTVGSPLVIGVYLIIVDVLTMAGTI